MLNRDFNTNAYNVDYKAIKIPINTFNQSNDNFEKEVFSKKILEGRFFADNQNSPDKPLNIVIDSINYNGNFIVHNKSIILNKNAQKIEQLKFDNLYLNTIMEISDTANATVYFTPKEVNNIKEKELVDSINFSQLYIEKNVTELMSLNENYAIINKTTSITEPLDFEVGDKIQIINKNNDGTSYGYLNKEKLTVARERGEKFKLDNGIINGVVSKVKESEVEITVSWFSILNSFFIIIFASLFSKWWDSKYNPSAAFKYGLGLIIMAAGFGFLAYGAHGVESGVKVSLIWLVFAYLFHTLGELCLSPVGLSYVSKPKKGQESYINYKGLVEISLTIEK